MAGSGRKAEREGAALAGSAFNCYGAMVGKGDMFNDGEAQSGATLGAAPGGIRAVKALEDPVEMFALNADPPVNHPDVHPVILP